MEQNTKKIGLINWVVLLRRTIGMLLVTRYVSSAAGVMGAVLAGFGLLVALMSYFQMGLLEREQFERLELEELSKSRGSESLFATAGADTFPAKRSREQFERYFIPALTASVVPPASRRRLLALEKTGVRAADHRRARDAGHGVAGNDWVDSVFAGKIFQRTGPAARAEVVAARRGLLAVERLCVLRW